MIENVHDGPDQAKTSREEVDDPHTNLPEIKAIHAGKADKSQQGSQEND